MKFKFTLLLLLLTCFIQFFSCNKIHYAFLDSVNLKFSQSSTDSFGNEIALLLDTNAVIDYKDLIISFESTYDLITNNFLNIGYEAYAYKRLPRYKLRTQITNIQIILQNDYNERYKANDDIFELIQMNSYESKAALLTAINIDNLEFIKWDLILGTLKEAPQDTVEFNLQILLTDEQGSIFHNKGVNIHLY